MPRLLSNSLSANSGSRNGSASDTYLAPALEALAVLYLEHASGDNDKLAAGNLEIAPTTSITALNAPETSPAR